MPPAPSSSPSPADRPSWLRLLACLLAAALTAALVPGPWPLRAGLAIFVGIAGLWMTQALPLAATALLVPVLAMGTGLLPPVQALAPFANPVIFLFLGGFVLAAALQRQGLAQAMAVLVLRLARGSRAAAAVLIGAMAAVLALWLSNTATALLMLPLALGLIDDMGEEAGPAEQAFVLLALAYGGALGGMASLVGTPPNAMAGAQAGISFATWAAMAAPVALLLWLAMLAILWTTLRPRLAGRLRTGPVALAWTRQQAATALVFVLTVAGWVADAPLAALLGLQGSANALVALGAVVALVATGSLGWTDIEREVQWGVLLLFGGGLALSEVMRASGASQWMVGHLLVLLQGAPPVLVLLGVVAFVVLLSEFMSNTASAALALPLFLPLAPSLGLAPEAMAMAIALAASVGFMLPVATPPNALVFGTGRVPQATMVRCGWRLDLACIAAITAAAFLLWR